MYEHKIASNNGESDYTHCLKYYSVLFKYFFYRGIRYAFGYSVLGEKICLTFNYIGRVFLFMQMDKGVKSKKWIEIFRH